MDYAKIMTEVIKAQTKGTFRGLWGHYMASGQVDCIAITYDGYTLHLIPESMWLVDMEKIAPPCNSVDSLVKFDTVSAELTGNMMVNPASTKDTLEEVRNAFGVSAWVDTKLLKRFKDRYSKLTFGMMDCDNPQTSPIRVYDNGMLQGVILPVRV